MRIAHFVARRPPFRTWQARYVQAFLLKLAPLCELFAGLGSTNKSAISLLVSDYGHALTTVSSPSLYLKIPGTCGKNDPFSPLLSWYNESPVTHFYRVITKPMSWPDKVLCFSHLQFDLTSLGRIENSSCSACSHLTQDASCFILSSSTADFWRC